MEKAEFILEQLFKNLSFGGKRDYLTKGASIFERWKDIAGEEIADRSVIREIERGSLIVEVEHAGISQLIMMKKRAIISTLGKKYPSLKIRTIRTITKRHESKRQINEAHQSRPQRDTIQGEDLENEGRKKKSGNSLDTIEDSRLKNALEKLEKTLEKKKKTSY